MGPGAASGSVTWELVRNASATEADTLGACVLTSPPGNSDAVEV